MKLDYKAIGKRIKIARIKSDMTQEMLSEKINLSVTHMSNIETGNSKLSLPTLVALANVLCVSADDLLCDNVIRSGTVFSQEIQDMISDCDHYELRVISALVKTTKESLRCNERFENNLHSGK